MHNLREVYSLDLVRLSTLFTTNEKHIPIIGIYASQGPPLPLKFANYRSGSVCKYLFGLTRTALHHDPEAEPCNATPGLLRRFRAHAH